MPSATANATARNQPSAQHQYGTRIRSNSVMRPSARLRQDSDRPTQPRRIKPVPAPKSKAAVVDTSPPQPDFPPFPPPHVMLHSDDASSKVFMAIGRSFMSVDNRAMTIKDLADMTLQYGLMCQNASAAGQAITTYLRSHLQRCEVQQDHPLLLRHVLSGTVHDDDLVPALHSRTGGAHCSLSSSDTRVTNFRRGTMVWYLSRAAGAPCPFARAGIRLCEYNENGKTGAVPNPGKERKRERDRLRRAEQCGQKRKRLLRACADKGSDSDSASEEEQPPPKVKLTLRLRPALISASSRSTTVSSSATAESLRPLEVREAIDITQAVEFDPESSSESESSDSDSSSDDMSVNSSDEEEELSMDVPVVIDSAMSSTTTTLSCRSPSLPYSTGYASAPPDSDDDDNDYHISMMAGRSSSYFDDDEDDEIWDDSDDEEGSGIDAETQWESPGPPSPESFVDDDAPVRVKHEPDTVGELLLQYERNALDAAFQQVAGDLVAEQVNFKTKVEDVQSPLEWDLHDGLATHRDDFVRVKQEESEHAAPLDFETSSSPQALFPTSPLSPSLVEHDSLDAQLQREVVWRNLEFLTSETRRELQSRENAWAEEQKLFPTTGSLMSSDALVSPGLVSSGSSAGLCAPLSPDLSSMSPPCDMSKDGSSEPVLPALSWIRSLTALSIPSPTSPTHVGQVDPFGHIHSLQSIHDGASAEPEEYDNAIHVCSANPAITARRLEGVYVYQLTLGPSEVALRRVDSDYVNFTHITRCFNFRLPQVPESVVVSRGSPSVCGIWLPRTTIKRLVSAMDHVNLPQFLSDSLHEHFPPILHESYRKTRLQSTTFGRQFESTADEERHAMQQAGLGFSLWQDGSHDDDIALRPFRLAGFTEPAALSEPTAIPDTPLSPTEEEMFHVLCAAPEWETASASATSQDSPAVTCEPVEPAPLTAVTNCADAVTAVIDPEPSPVLSKEPPRRERPLRRSKRVVHAMTTRSRTRSSKRGSRSSLA